MFSYGSRSRDKRDSCHPNLVWVMNRGLEFSPVDITIVWGWRDEAIQDTFYQTGLSKLMWPYSKHNAIPNSLAFDFAPWVNNEIPWKDTHLFALLAGCFFSAAKERDIELRWGGDWDRDGLTTDQSFFDWGHIELFGDEYENGHNTH